MTACGARVRKEGEGEGRGGWRTTVGSRASCGNLHLDLDLNFFFYVSQCQLASVQQNNTGAGGRRQEREPLWGMQKQSKHLIKRKYLKGHSS